MKVLVNKERFVRATHMPPQKGDVEVEVSPGWLDDYYAALDSWSEFQIKLADLCAMNGRIID